MEQQHRKNLIPLRISYIDSDSVWNFKPDEEGFSSYSFKASPDMVRKLFRKLKIKDSMKGANSHKEVRYNDMIDGIIKKSNNTVYIWRSRYPQSVEDVRRMISKE